MSTPTAQVTEAHIRLANQLVSSPPSPLVLAQLIADSEARAVAGQNAVIAEWLNRAATVSAERDQLRAERDQLRAALDDIAAQLGISGRLTSVTEHPPRESSSVAQG